MVDDYVDEVSEDESEESIEEDEESGRLEDDEVFPEYTDHYPDDYEEILNGLYGHVTTD